MVPLLTWSSTIRHAGKPREEKRHQEEKLIRLLERLKEEEARTVSHTDAQVGATTKLFERRRRRLHLRSKRRESRSDDIAVASRTILLMWACLVTAGFICTFVAIIDHTPGSRYGHFDLFDASQATEISCSPENGTLDLSTVGSIPYSTQFFFTSEFFDVNNCIDPCPITPTVSGPLWFRAFSDLQSLTKAELVFATGDPGSHAQLSLILSYANQWSWIWVYMIAQGIWAVCLGRNQPFETRIHIYGLITRILAQENSESSTLTKAFAKFVAFGAYLGAIGIALISLPLLVLNVTLIELYILQLPQSETPNHVGAWNGYAVIGLGLLSFLVANVKTRHHLKGFWNMISNNMRGPNNCRPRRERESQTENFEASNFAVQNSWLCTYENVIDYIMEQRNDIGDALQEEWKYTKTFWNESDRELAKYRQRKQETREET
jgi:hypothetical protein